MINFKIEKREQLHLFRLGHRIALTAKEKRQNPQLNVSEWISTFLTQNILKLNQLSNPSHNFEQNLQNVFYKFANSDVFLLSQYTVL